MNSIGTAAPRYFVDKTDRGTTCPHHLTLDNHRNEPECHPLACPVMKLDCCSDTARIESRSMALRTRGEQWGDDTSSCPLSVCICRAFRDSGYPLKNVDCSCDDETVILRGRVTRYFFAQMALELAKKYSSQRRIEMCIDVVPLVLEVVNDC